MSKLRVIGLIAAMAWGSNFPCAIAQEVEVDKCVGIASDPARLACFDEAVLRSKRPVAGDKVTVTDVMADFDELRGKHVQVQGFLIMMGEQALLYKSQGEMSALFLDTKNISRDQRHSIFENCGHGCDVVVHGTVERVMMQLGMIIDNAAVR